MLVSYTVFGEQEKIIYFLKRISKYINFTGSEQYFICESEELEDIIYAVSFSIVGKSTTKQLAKLAEKEVALLYSFRLPNCSFEKMAYKAADSHTYTQISKNCMPYSEYLKKPISSEEFFNESHILFELDDYEDMESYEERIY